MQIIDLVHGTASPEYLHYETFHNRLDECHPCIHSLLGAGVGISGELGEFNEIIKKHVWQGKDFDTAHAVKELGDILWYVGLACIALGVTVDEVEEIVSNKLMARYSETNGRFNKQQSENRKANDV